MNRYNLQRQFETEQYYNQANLVYINSAILCFIVSFIFIFWVDSYLAALLNIIGSIVSIIAFLLNRSRKYACSALIYIGSVTVIAASELILFGPLAGFQYYFFNLSVLIFFAKWKSIHKVIGVFLEVIILLSISIYALSQPPIIHLTGSMILFFHSLNAILNIAGVANSSRYYINIATNTQNKITELASRDYLTGLKNRTAFDGYIDEIFEKKNKQASTGLSILLLDIDFFKSVNDQCGHMVGDELLKSFGSLLLEHKRPDDFVARYGGEEFIIINSSDNPNTLYSFAEKIRTQVEKMTFFCGKNEKRITVSIGALYISDLTDIHRQQAIENVDKLLYKAKDSGRNRVAFEQI